MRRTVGELRAELLKAGRGAGLPLGVAEDIAAAAPWFTADAVQDLVERLDRADAPRALAQLAHLLDRRAAGDRADAPDTPLWTALTACQDGAPAVPGPLVVAAPLWSRLSAYSARTYVPETAASRARGAGAGNIDND